jgi:hypothetical protein
MKYEDAINIFVDDINWYIINEFEDTVSELDEETGENSLKTIVKTEIYDNSDYSLAGDIIDHRDGTITVKMGKLTAQEMLAIIEGVL